MGCNIVYRGHTLGIVVGLAALAVLLAGSAGAATLTVNASGASPKFIAQASKWIEKADTFNTGGYGEAVVGTKNNIYIVRGLYTTSDPESWRYNASTNSWNSINTSGLPVGAFRSGTALTWDHGDYIYGLFGGRYSSEDINRSLFYRYSILNNTWEQLTDTPHAQGAGDAITWSGYDGYIYTVTGSNQRGTAFARYKNNSWETLDFNTNWTVTDDGASLVWTGGEYLYALRGEYDETVPNGDFARYNIPMKIWEDMKDIFVNNGVGDGASLLWIEEYPDYIFALSGGEVDETPGYNFYRYSIADNDWKQLGSVPYPIGYYVGNRLGFANGHIYYWQGTPSTWYGGGNKFFMFDASANSIAGNILYSTNATGIQGITVNLTNSSGTVASTTTNTSGFYSFTDIASGSYYINASKPAFFVNSTGITVMGGNATVDMMLWLKGNLNNNDEPADAGDLVLMKRASIGEIPSDFRYDLNNNGIPADAGDLVLMKRASIGEVVLS